MSIKWPVLLLLLLVAVGVMLVRRFRNKKFPPVFVGESSVLTKLPSYQKASRRAIRLRRVERVLLAGMLIGLLLVAARPQAILTSYNQQKSRDTVLCLDVSGSMKEYIPLALNTLEQVYKQNPTDRYSIVVFGSRAITVLPLTRDQIAIQQKIDMLREVYEKDNDPNYRFRSIPGYGTDVGEGVLTSVQRFNDLKTYKTRNIILVSDLDQTGGDFDPESQKYLDKIGLVPKNRINFYVLQPPLEYKFATSPQRIMAASGGQLFKIDENNAQASARQLLDQIFAQILNTTIVTGKNEADYPYLVLGTTTVIAFAWTIVVFLRWRYV